MNEEEKKAIEELSKKAVLCNYEERDYPNMICFKKDVLIALNLIEKLQKENEELKKNYINVQNNTNTTFHKVVPPPEPQLPTKTLCESFSKKVRNNNEII